MAEIVITKKIEKIIQDAQKLGIADYYAVRDLRVKDEYRRLRKTKDYYDAIVQVSKNFSIAPKTVETILSGINSKRKKSKKWQ